jgi:hypothetical protein
MVMTLDLSGARATYQKQPVRTAPIPQTDSSDGVVPWWQSKFPWLNDFDASDLEIVSGTQTLTIENPGNYPGLTPADLPNELLSGSIAAWMNLNAAPLLVSATMQYTGETTDEASAVFDANNQRVLYTRVTGTNAQTQTYSRLTSETEAEPVPAGLAQALYDATSVVQYDGVLELTEQECSGQGTPGVLLNLSGGRAEWATMAAQIQRVEEQIDLGITKITVGPAKHLGQSDLTTLMRANRSRRISFRLGERTSGSGSGNAAKVQGGELTPRSDSVFRPSASAPAINRPFELLDASDETGLKVTVNANSFMLQSLTPNDLVSVSGLGGAIAVDVGMQIWLEIDFNPDMSVSAVSVNSDDGGWSGFPAPFVYSGTYPDQILTTAFALIGYIVATSSTLDGPTITGGPTDAPVSAKIVQCISQDLLLQNVVFNGLPAIFPFPHHAPSV